MEGGPRPLDPAARDDTPLGRGILLSQSRDGHKRAASTTSPTPAPSFAPASNPSTNSKSPKTARSSHPRVHRRTSLAQQPLRDRGLDRAFAQEWTDHIYTYRVSDLVCPSGLLTANQWDNTIIRYASYYSRKSDAWIDERQRERPIIIGDIPTAFKRAIDAPAPPFKDGDIVLAVDKAMHTERYARYQASTDGGPDTLAELCGSTRPATHTRLARRSAPPTRRTSRTSPSGQASTSTTSNPSQAMMTRHRRSAPRSSARSRARFNTLIAIQPDGTYTLTDAFSQAIQDAKLAHEARGAAPLP